MAARINESILQAIDAARKAAESAKGDWEFDVKTEGDDDGERIEVRVIFRTRPESMEGVACDAPWREYGGDAIVEPLEAAGFRQGHAWTETYERRTCGGGSVPCYEDGVVLEMEI